MDINKKIHIESIKSLNRFFQTYIPDEKSHKKHKISNPNVLEKHSHEKINSSKKHDIKRKKKINSNNNIYSVNHNNCNHNHNHHHYKSSELINKFNRKNQFYKNNNYKSQDRPIKINLVNRKFKIADDFNEKNSNQFLNEKDECLREVFLSDKIEEEEIIPFFIENENGSLYDISPIRKNDYEYILNSKQFKRKKEKEDSLKFLSKLIEDIK